MGSKTYRQICGVARALDLVGERWTLLIVRDLLLGPMSYSELLQGMPGLTTNLLAKRLKDLTEAGLLEAVEVNPEASSRGGRGLYGLTKAGLALGPVISGLSEWGMSHGPSPTCEDRMNFRWLPAILSRTYRQQGQRWIIQLVSDDQCLQLRLGTAEFEAIEGTPMKADLKITGDGPGLHALLSGDQRPDELLKAGKVEIEGRDSDFQQAWDDFLDSFALRD